MYQPKHFSENRPELLHRVIREHPFATLIVMKDGVPEVNHVPLILSDDAKFLRGHLARGNGLAHAAMSGSKMWVVFHGPHAYVTPTWYPSKQEDGKVVPTWNYMVVHVEGVMRLTDEPSWLLKNVEDLSTHHEVLRHSQWRIHDAPADYLQMMTRGIMGLEIEVTSMTGKFKLSQNKSPADHGGVATGLESAPNQTSAEQQVADWMRLIGVPTTR
jgi:transcriptional regulator